MEIICRDHRANPVVEPKSNKNFAFSQRSEVDAIERSEPESLFVSSTIFQLKIEFDLFFYLSNNNLFPVA